jgi:hypothetical protein
MTTLQDAKLTALEALTGNTGHVNDLEAEFLVSLGATAGSAIVDQWWEVFDAAAVPPGQFNDRAVAYIVATVGVPPSNDYNEHWRFYWENFMPGPVVPVPPLLADLLHWFDFSDATQLWQDGAGTVPIVAGTDVIRVDNKGTDGTPLIDAFPPGPIWTLDLVNGLAGAKHTTNFSPMQQAGWLGAGGAGGQVNFGWGRREALGPSTGLFWQQSGGGGDDQLRVDDGAIPAGEWAVATAGLGVPTGTGKPMVLDEWDWVYVGVDNTLNQIYRAGGVAEQSGGGAYAPPGSPSSASLGMPQGELIEVLVYGRGLTPAEVQLVIDYMNARAGNVMPFLEPPTTVPELLHHFDFTDNTTVFKNPPATQPAGDGDFIRHVLNKGTDGTSITSVSDGVSPIYRTGVINGLNIADYDAILKNLDAVVAAGHASSVKGLSMALVFRWGAGGAATNNMAAWDNNLMRTSATRHGNHFVQGVPGSVFSVAPLAGSTWYLGAFAFDGPGAGTDRWQWSGEIEQTAVLGGLTDIPPGSTIEIQNAGTTIQVAEYAVWDGQLSAAEFASLFAYADAKYGNLPNPPVALSPPFLANLSHWWDFTDAATVFADTLGVVPITDGTIIERVNDKGTAADDLLDAGSGITWHTGVVNSLSVARNTVVQAPSRFTSQALATLIGGVSGFCYGGVHRLFNVPGGQGILHAVDNGPSEVTIETGFGTWSEDHPNQGTTPSNKAVVSNEWVSAIVSDGGAGPDGYRHHVSAAADVTAVQSFAIQTGTPVEIFAQSVDGEIGEILVYDRALNSGEVATLQTYYDTKYNALPHL